MTNKARIWLQWIIIGFLSIQFLGASVAKLLGLMCGYFCTNGLSTDFMLFVGFIEALSVVGLFFTSLRIKASLIQIAIMLAASYLHLLNNEMMLLMLTITNIGLSSIIIWAELDCEYMANEIREVSNKK